MNELRDAVRELISSPSAPGADAVNQQLRLTPASDELARFICETLEVTALHEVQDSTRTTMRWRLIDRLLSLGFPHALHVSPEDLEYHRRGHFGGGGPIAASVTGVVAFLSMLWSFGLGFAFSSSVWFITAPLFALGVYSLLCLVSAVHVSKGHTSRAIGKLGACAALYPLGAFAAEGLWDHTAAVIGMVLAAPALATALLCLLTASLQRKETATAPAVPTAALDDAAPLAEPKRTAVNG